MDLPQTALGTLGTLGTGQVGMQALMMHSEWFAVGRSGAEGPREEHFLWHLERGGTGNCGTVFQ